MAERRIMQLKSTLYVSIPAGLCHVLGIEKGDRVRVDYLPGVGILVNKNYPGGEVPVQLSRLGSLREMADEIVESVRRQVMSLERSAVTNVANRLLGVGFEKGREAEIYFRENPSISPPALLADPFLQEEVMLLEARSQTGSNTKSQTGNPPRIQTGSQTVSRKKINGVQKAHRRKGRPGKSVG